MADSEIVIREVTKGVWTFSRPFTLFNRLAVGGRSTAIKLDNGKVWILASTPLTEQTREKLQELGDVRYIVAGNHFHNIFLKDYKIAYPSAIVIGPEELNEKKKHEGWQLDSIFSVVEPRPKLDFEDEIEHCFFSGYKNKDTAYYHRASKTVVAADLLFNLPSTEQYALAKSPAPYLPFISSFSPYGWIMQVFVWSKEVDKA
ncbi:hypothetical protein EW026_g1390 [Hermanssonia centrifuga]|uniref:DUF4336 domain-containing protein n=1 Tax=Hermanssonia centrifuga TaxID=98765 RepID=A0A4S4KS25_9APHY|nr:hypothetical protein EW026_g1390 [Hermanssonia centrifuga]